MRQQENKDRGLDSFEARGRTAGCFVGSLGDFASFESTSAVAVQMTALCTNWYEVRQLQSLALNSDFVSVVDPSAGSPGLRCCSGS